MCTRTMCPGQAQLLSVLPSRRPSASRGAKEVSEPVITLSLSLCVVYCPLSLCAGPVQAKSVGYVNVPNQATISDDYRYILYSLIPRHCLLHCNTADCPPLPACAPCSVLEPVQPQTPSAPLRGDDYSRLDLTGHLELEPPNSPPSQNGQHGARPRNKGQ